MKKKLMVPLRVTYMLGGPLIAIFLNKILGNKISFLTLITIFSLLIANTIYQKVKQSNSVTVKAWLYRFSVWFVGIILAQLINYTFGGILIYVLLFISFLFTYMDNNEIISFVEDFINDRKIKNLILIFSILLIGSIIYTLSTVGYDGLIKYF